MNTTARDYPVGSLRVCDADRDRALSQLSEAFQAGRITAGELDQRSGQALSARTGEELTVLLADLPHDRPAAKRALIKPAHRVIGARVTMGASAVTAAAFWAVSISSALSYAPKTLQQREFAQRVAEHLHTKMVETNDKKHLVRRVPAVDQISKWIEQSKKLPRAVFH